MSFIPKRWLVAYCHQIGYEIVNTIDFPNDDPEVKFISWIELRKPGQLTTIKRMQALGGKIILSNRLQDLNKSYIINYQRRNT
jgi:hypothetical protein